MSQSATVVALMKVITSLCMCNMSAALLTLIVFVLSQATTRAGEFELSFRKQVSEFIESLDKEQSKDCLYEIDDKRRWRMQYTGGKRPGIEISRLNPTQRVALEKALRLVLSDHGWKMANEVANQDVRDGEEGVDGVDALGKYWITCFGDPRQGDFAFRLAEHHLTIVRELAAALRPSGAR